MSYNAQTQAGLPPISRRHKAGLILLSKRLSRKLTAQLENMIDQSCRAQGISVLAIKEDEINNILNTNKK